MTKKLLLAAALPLACLASACATMPSPSGNAVLVLGVEAAEAGTRLRCPRSAVELAALRGVRIGFDLAYGSQLSASEQDRVGLARRLTDAVCGLDGAP